jgi:hypothetical protein
MKQNQIYQQITRCKQYAEIRSCARMRQLINSNSNQIYKYINTKTV